MGRQGMKNRSCSLVVLYKTRPGREHALQRVNCENVIPRKE
jgi:hypothetical protein